MEKNEGPQGVSRRDFLKATGLVVLAAAGSGGLSMLAGSCQSPATNSTAPTTSPKPKKSITRFSARMDDGNSLIFHFEGPVTTPGQVVVQYGAPGVGPFVTAPVATIDNTFSIDVVRLRPATQYSYQVFLTASGKTPVSVSQGTFISGPLPPALKAAKIQITKGTPSWDLLLLDHNCTGFNGLIGVDRTGQIVWYFQNDNPTFTLDQQPNYNLVFCELSQVIGYRMKEISPSGRVFHSVEDTLESGAVCAPNGRFNHEIRVRPDGKIWTMGAEIRAVTINGTNTFQCGGTIEEWDPATGAVNRLNTIFDTLDPVKDRAVDSDTTGGFFWVGGQNQYLGIAQDWTHHNALAFAPDGTVVMSMRHLNQVVGFKPDLSGLKWRLGGPGSDFTFPNPSDQFYHQHYSQMLPNGHILLFDNGNTRPAAEGGEYSRALELALDFKTMQATKVWEYRNQPDLFAG